MLSISLWAMSNYLRISIPLYSRREGSPMSSQIEPKADICWKPLWKRQQSSCWPYWEILWGVCVHYKRHKQFTIVSFSCFGFLGQKSAQLMTTLDILWPLSSSTWTDKRCLPSPAAALGSSAYIWRVEHLLMKQLRLRLISTIVFFMFQKKPFPGTLTICQ